MLHSNNSLTRLPRVSYWKTQSNRKHVEYKKKTTTKMELVTLEFISRHILYKLEIVLFYFIYN